MTARWIGQAVLLISKFPEVRVFVIVIIGSGVGDIESSKIGNFPDVRNAVEIAVQRRGQVLMIPACQRR